MKMSIIIPCYNSTDILRTLIAETIREIRVLPIEAYEFVLVNDGSPNEKTFPFLLQLTKEFPNIKLIDLAKNTGQANAQVAALHYVTGDVVVNLDDDMQTHPKNIAPLFNKLMEGYDLVLGKYPVKRHAFHRRILTKMDDIFESVFLKKPSHLSFTSFWVVRKYIVDEIIKYNSPYAFMEGLFLRTAGKIANVDIPHYERQEGVSGYNIFKLFKLWSNFTTFTVKPLRVAGIVGVFISIISFIWAFVLIVGRIFGNVVPGYTSLMCFMLISFGITLLCFGLLGEYVGRIFMVASKAPQYVVRHVYESETEE